MTDFNPGNKWREITHEERTTETGELLALREARTMRMHYWVRNDPMPPLPTEPYTVIRVRWNARIGALEDDVLTLQANLWRDTSDGALSGEELAQYINGFEVLALSVGFDFNAAGLDHRAQIAKAVIDWIAKKVPLTTDIYLGALREFGEHP